MPDLARCSKCQHELPANAPLGLCPMCLLGHGMDDPSLSSADAGAPAATAPENVVMPDPGDATEPGEALRDDDVQSGAPLGFLEPPQDPDFLGRLDHYQVQSVVGRGGMGVLLRAF